MHISQLEKIAGSTCFSYTFAQWIIKKKVFWHHVTINNNIVVIKQTRMKSYELIWKEMCQLYHIINVTSLQEILLSNF